MPKKKKKQVKTKKRKKKREVEGYLIEGGKIKVLYKKDKGLSI